MPKPRLTKLELQVLEAFWQKGPCSVRKPFLGLTGLLTRLYRRSYIASKGKRPLAEGIGNANVFEAVISRQDAQGRLINDLLAALGGPRQAGDGASGGTGRTYA
jgi:hypothetical protein